MRAAARTPRRKSSHSAILQRCHRNDRGASPSARPRFTSATHWFGSNHDSGPKVGPVDRKTTYPVTSIRNGPPCPAGGCTGRHTHTYRRDTTLAASLPCGPCVTFTSAIPMGVRCYIRRKPARLRHDFAHLTHGPIDSGNRYVHSNVLSTGRLAQSRSRRSHLPPLPRNEPLRVPPLRITDRQPKRARYGRRPRRQKC